MTKPRKRVKKSKGATKIEGSSEAKPINVAIIVGRASIDEDFDENGKRRRISERAKRRIMEEKQENWRAAAKALAHPFVFEGFRVNKPFTKMGNRVRKQKKFIDTLYIICHADIGGIGEIVRVPGGFGSGSATIDNVATRIKRCTKRLGKRAPKLLQFLSCYGGGDPELMSKIGKAVDATTVRAPIGETYITALGYSIKVRGKNIRVTKEMIKRTKRATLKNDIKQLRLHQSYDFVPGVPHKPEPSKEDKLEALVDVMRKTGLIPIASFHLPHDHSGAVPIWKAKIKPVGSTYKRGSDEDELCQFEMTLK